VVGILTRTDLLAAMARSPVVAPPGPTSTVGDYMTRDVLALRPDTHLIDAAASMVQRGVRHAPVIDGMNRVVGVLSDRDVRSAIGDLRAVLSEAALPSRLKRLRVQQAMTSDPRTLTVDEPLADAVVVFLGERFGAMPVVDEAERLVGILSYVDVLAAVARAHPERMD
jgi:CBS domain-containing protein